MPRFPGFALLLSCVVCVPTLLPAQIVVGSYPTTVFPELSSSSPGAVIGDYNGDGIPDAAAMLPDGTVQVLFGSPSGFFRKGPPTPSAGAGIIYAAADFNRDGKLDVAAVLSGATGAAQAAIFLGNGDGTFRAPILTAFPGVGTVSVLATDLNADGLPDLVITSSDRTVNILLGSGTGAFTFASQTTGMYCSGSAAADFDGDGKVDLALACQYPELLLGKGDGTFAAPIQIDTVGPSEVAVADLNHDGRPDLVYSLLVTGTTSPYLNVYLNQGGLQFAPATYYADALFGGCCGTHQIGIADVNGDGNPDIFATGGSVQVLFGAGDGTFPGSPDTHTQVGGNNVVATDFNRDGVPDLVETSGILTVLLGKGGGKFFNPPALTFANSPGTYPNPVAKIDLDGDGLDDLIFESSSASGGNTLSTALNQGTGRFLASSLNVFTDSTRNGITPFHCCVVAADLNGDGRQDIVYGSSAGAIQISLSGSAHTFSPATTIATFPSSDGVAAVETADFNSDGNPDIAVLYPAKNAGFQDYLALAILTGNGRGGFHLSKMKALPYGYGCPSSAGCSLQAGDFNGDGKADLAYFDLAGVHVLLGSGDASFLPAFDGSLPENGGMVVRDLNGDGLADIALLDSSTPNSAVSVLLSLGNGTFSRFNYSLPSLASFLTVADLNGDGSPELIAAGGAVLTPLQNNGDGTFVLARSWSFGYASTILSGAFLAPGQPSLLTSSAVFPVANK